MPSTAILCLSLMTPVCWDWILWWPKVVETPVQSILPEALWVQQAVMSASAALINGVGEAEESGKGKSRYSDTDNGFFCMWPASRRLCRVVTWPQSLEVMGKRVSHWVHWVIYYILSQWGSLGQLICFHPWISRQQLSRKGNAILLFIYFCNL